MTRAPTSVRCLLAVPLMVVLASACSGSNSTKSTSTPGPATQVGATVPPPGAAPANPPPDLPPRGPAMPPETVDLIDLHRQGQTDVVR